jgi:excisionase family DNA binding protein
VTRAPVDASGEDRAGGDVVELLDAVSIPAPDPDELLTPGQAARLFGVDPKTVGRWADAGRLAATRTLGGHRRYRRGDLDVLLAEHRSAHADDAGHQGPTPFGRAASS